MRTTTATAAANASSLSWPFPKTVVGAEKQWETDEVIGLMIEMILADWRRYAEDGDSLEDHYDTTLQGAKGAIDQFFTAEFDDYPECLEIVAAALDHAMLGEFEFWAQQEDE